MITDVELLVIRKAIQNLQTIGCNVGVVDKDGNSYGGFSLMPIGEVKRKRAAPVHKRGTISGYLDPYLSLLTDVGDVIDVPMSPLFENTSKLNSAISAYMCNHYGKGTVKVEAQSELKAVRVYRLEGTKND
jgi:hypothetical protein